MGLTVDEINRRVGLIDNCSADDEAAHSEEDELYRDVLKAIADGTAEQPAKCAAAALETRDITFARWCA